ncbi:hypothetical protein [Almyronema epifaneia]|uniref:Uncharacterized protein n=1 Tax=Almyronema epifaneia S1 TaxID=2991925 RepID=A0ABW6IGC9_9CYAN
MLQTQLFLTSHGSEMVQAVTLNHLLNLPQHRRLRHYLVGSPTDTQNVIDRLYLLGYRDRSAWSHPVDIPENGVLIRPDPGDILRYSQQRQR